MTPMSELPAWMWVLMFAGQVIMNLALAWDLQSLRNEHNRLVSKHNGLLDELIDIFGNHVDRIGDLESTADHLSAALKLMPSHGDLREIKKFIGAGGH